MSDLTTLTGQLAAMKQTMIDRLTAQGATGYTMSSTMEDIVAAYSVLRNLDYDTTTITENGTYTAPAGKTGYNNFVVNVPAGGPATHKRFSLFDRVYEDVNGTAIGTVFGFKTDANNNEYAQVVLDAANRQLGGRMVTDALNSTAASMIPGSTGWSKMYDDTTLEETRCDTLVSAAASQSSTCPAIEFCRSKTYTIAGQTYTGQLCGGVMSIVKVLSLANKLNSLDPTATSNPTVVIPTTNTSIIIYTAQKYTSGLLMFQGGNYGLFQDSRGWGNSTTSSFLIMPILEIPNTVVSNS